MKVKGYELIKDINVLEIGTRIKNEDNKIYILEQNGNGNRKFSRAGKRCVRFCTYEGLNKTYEILEDDTEEIRIRKDEKNMEYVEYKNGGVTESGYTRSYSKFDIMIFKRIEELENKLKESDKNE